MVFVFFSLFFFSYLHLFNIEIWAKNFMIFLLLKSGSCESLSFKGGALTGSDSGVLELSDSGGGPPGEWDAVPGVVRQCIRHIEATGLRTLGIFRISPSKKRVRQVNQDIFIKFIENILVIGFLFRKDTSFSFFKHFCDRPLKY